MNSLEERLLEKLDERKNSNAFRKLYGQSLIIDFCSNDYLGLAKSPEVHQKISQLCISEFPLGSTGSRLISGDSSEYQYLEAFLSDFHRGEASLMFNSGYDANVGFFSTIPQRGDIILYDELCHASMRDGIRLSLARGYPFAHNDSSALRLKLEQFSGNIFVAIESIYSMDGNRAAIEKFVALCEEFGAHLIVDEAHSTGIYGKYGEGLAVSLGLESKIFARLHTFGKAIGAHGAIWVGSNLLKDYLVNYCRSFIYTTALPEYSIAHIKSAYIFLLDNHHKIDLLHQKIQFFKELVEKNEIIGFIPSDSPIQSCIVPGNDNVKKVASYLQENGFDVRPILHPTVANNEERIRICIHEYNTNDEISQLLKTLKRGLA